MKLCVKLMSVVMVLVLLLGVVPPFTVSAGGTKTRITEGNLEYLATAMNAARETLPYKEGAFSAARIFNEDAAGFKNIFQASTMAFGEASFVEGDSMMAISSQIEKKFGISGAISGEIPVNGSKVSLSVAGSYNHTLGSSLQNQNYFSYQYLGAYMQTIRVYANWFDGDLTNFFDEKFIRAYNKISSLSDAEAFIDAYGSHVFTNYYFGGIVELTKQVVSEVNIQEAYEQNEMDLSLKVGFNKAADLAANSRTYNMEDNSLSNKQTKSDTGMHTYGGDIPASITVAQLFDQTQQIGSSTPTSYPYKDWKDSLINERSKEVVVKASGGVPIWDLLENSSYYDAEKCGLLQEAFNSIYLDSFAEALSTIDESYSFVKEANYVNKKNDGESVRVPQNKELVLPPNVEAVLTADTTYLGAGDISYVMENAGTDLAEMSGNVITTGRKTGSFNVGVYAHGIQVDTLKVTISENPFNGGEGSRKDPYVIGSAEEFINFLNSHEYYGKYFKLVANIDLKGEHIAVGGSAGLVGFSGTLDGNGYTVSNATVISNSKWGLVGLFGAHTGTIKNLTIKDFVCINDGVIQPTSEKGIMAGILAGYNSGTIENVQVVNSAIRISAHSDKNKGFYVGAVVGYNDGSMSGVGSSECKVVANAKEKINEGIFGIGAGTEKTNMDAYVGGLVGQNNKGSMSNVYCRYTTIMSKGIKTDYMGGLVGYVAAQSDTAISCGIVYDVTIKDMGDDDGYVCGTNKASAPFSNCLYDYEGATKENAVAGGNVSGCNLIKGLTADALSGSTWREWTADDQNMPILKAHQ